MAGNLQQNSREQWRIQKGQEYQSTGPRTPMAERRRELLHQKDAVDTMKNTWVMEVQQQEMMMMLQENINQEELSKPQKNCMAEKRREMHRLIIPEKKALNDQQQDSLTMMEDNLQQNIQKQHNILRQQEIIKQELVTLQQPSMAEKRRRRHNLLFLRQEALTEPHQDSFKVPPLVTGDPLQIAQQQLQKQQEVMEQKELLAIQKNALKNKHREEEEIISLQKKTVSDQLQNTMAAVSADVPCPEVVKRYYGALPAAAPRSLLQQTLAQRPPIQESGSAFPPSQYHNQEKNLFVETAASARSYPVPASPQLSPTEQLDRRTYINQYLSEPNSNKAFTRMFKRTMEGVISTMPNIN